MIKINLFLLMALLWLHIPAAGQQQAVTTITFSVKDQVTGFGIGNAEVKVTTPGGGSRTLQADAYGKLTLGMDKGKYTFTVTAGGYEPLETYFEGGEGTEINATISMDPAGGRAAALRADAGARTDGRAVLTGYVRDVDTNMPLAGVEVSAGTYKGTSNSDGFFSILYDAPVPALKDYEKPETISVRATKKGYVPHVIENIFLMADTHTMQIALASENSPAMLQKARQQRAPVLEEVEKEVHGMFNRTETDEAQREADYEAYVRAEETRGAQRSAVQAAIVVPTTIRIGRNCNCNSCSSVEVMSLEAYVESGLDEEWISGWGTEALKAGAVAYRSYGAYHVLHPSSSSYDLSTTTCKQAWGPDRYTRTVNAARATAGTVLNKNGAIFRSEYSSENNNSGCGNGYSGTGTSNGWPCISDSRCYGRNSYGHGRGMCQYGSSFWASDKTYTWILNHYYNPGNVYIELPPPTAATTITFTTKSQSSGNAIANASVTITAPNGSTSTDQTDAAGNLVFGADEGTYTFTFSAGGYAPITTHFTAGDDAAITADVNMDLTSAASEPVPGVPDAIRVATNCACASCSNPVVQIMSLEAYVQTGLDDEWIASWPAASLQAGAVAYRSRGAFYAQNPVADNYDVSDAACHQTWQDDRATSVKDAAIATAGIVLTKNGVIVRPAYGAETNNGGCGNGYSGTGSTNHPCIADERCVGRANNGGGEGMCQWGSSFWATDHTYTWILEHYYGPAGIVIATPAPTTPITFTTKSQETGTAVGGASVTVVDPNGVSSTLATNSSGTLVFDAGPGEYTFTFSASGYAPITTRFTGGDEGEAITADINLDATASASVPGVPDAIRVATNCACAACPDPVVQVMSLEAYVQTGVDDEWLSSWPAASLQAGAVAYRSRGAFYAQNPVGDNYDLSAAACHQTWQDDRATSVKNAAIATAGVVLVKDGAIVRPDYGAETNNGGCGDGYSGTGTTDHPCIADDRCVGRANSGGGEGMCQWGSSFWATDHNYTWILDHYYSPAGISIQAPTAALVAASSTALNEAESNSYLVVSPNPITGHEVKVGYTLQGDAQAALIMLTDNGGQPLQQKKVNLQNGYNEVMLETGTLKNGVYIVTIQLATGKPESKKLIVTK